MMMLLKARYTTAIASVIFIGISITYADDTIKISVVNRYQPYINDLIDAFLKEKACKQSLKACNGGSESPNVANYANQKYDIMLFHDKFTDYECVHIEWKMCPLKTIWSKYRYFLGQKRMIVIASNELRDVKSLNLNDLLYYLTNHNKEDSYKHTLGKIKTVFAPDEYAPEMKDKITTVKYMNTNPCSIDYALFANTLLTRFKTREKYQFTQFAGHDTWIINKSKYESCKSTDEIIDNVYKRQNAIGVIPYMLRPVGHKNRVTIISLQKNDDSCPVFPPLKPIINKDYPFSLSISLFVHPESPDIAHKFCAFCVSESGARISEKYGFITPWHERQYYADQRVKAMKAGKGDHVRMIGDALFAEAAQDLAVAYVRAKEPIQLHYVPHAPGIDAGYINRFVTAAKRKQDYEMPLFLCRGPITPDGPKDLAGLKQYRLAASAPVVVVNAANDIPSLTPAAVEKIFTGRVRQWDAVSDATGRIAACVLQKDPAVGRHVRRHGAGRIPPAIHRCGDRRALFGRIAADVKSIGLIGAAHLAGGRDTRPAGLRVVAIEGAVGPVMPRVKAMMSGAYPLSAGMYACVAGDAGEAAADLVAFLRSEDAQAAFEACGMITAATRLRLPGEGENAAPGMPAGEDADGKSDQAETDAAQSKEEQTIPESAEGDGVGGLPFD